MQISADTIREFENRALNGDGQFAIALALFNLAESHDRLRRDLCFGDGDSGANRVPGVLEKLATEHAGLVEVVREAAS